MNKLHNRITPRWRELVRKLIECMKSCEVDHTITYSDLSEVAGFQITSSSRPLRSALMHLEKQGIAFRNIYMRGYERSNNTVIATTEVPRSRRKTFRAGKRAMRKISCVDESKLTPQNRVSLWAERMAVSQVVHKLHGNAVRAETRSTSETNTIKDALKQFMPSS
jgi:hypothetical protein